MFGCITANRGELKVRELARYESWYCGLCLALGDRDSIAGRLTLSYDMTFLAMLLSSLYDEPISRAKILCPVHPLKRHRMRRTVFTDYAADMNVLLSYYDRLDDWKDERKTASYLQAKALQPGLARIKKEYPRQYRAVREYIRQLTDCEQTDSGSIELAASLTGKMLAEVFAVREDEWAQQLRTMGFFLGKFIYFTDAYEDIDKDIRSGSYNPFKGMSGREDFDDACRDILAMQMAECCRAFERLPLVRDVGILRNILYSGVWSGYAGAYRQRNGLRP